MPRYNNDVKEQQLQNIDPQIQKDSLNLRIKPQRTELGEVLRQLDEMGNISYNDYSLLDKAKASVTGTLDKINYDEAYDLLEKAFSMDLTDDQKSIVFQNVGNIIVKAEERGKYDVARKICKLCIGNSEGIKKAKFQDQFLYSYKSQFDKLTNFDDKIKLLEEARNNSRYMNKSYYTQFTLDLADVYALEPSKDKDIIKTSEYARNAINLWVEVKEYNKIYQYLHKQGKYYKSALNFADEGKTNVVIANSAMDWMMQGYEQGGIPFISGATNLLIKSQELYESKAIVSDPEVLSKFNELWKMMSESDQDFIAEKLKINPTVYYYLVKPKVEVKEKVQPVVNKDEKKFWKVYKLVYGDWHVYIDRVVNAKNSQELDYRYELSDKFDYRMIKKQVESSDISANEKKDVLSMLENISDKVRELVTTTDESEIKQKAKEIKELHDAYFDLQIATQSYALSMKKVNQLE